MIKISTKICPKCGNDKLILLYSHHKKLCINCKYEISWHLDKGQKSLLEKNKNVCS